jgi:hypothetical protein
VILVARRWRRGGTAAGGDREDETGLTDADARRLDEELAAFDR